MHIIRLRGPWEVEPLKRYVARESGGYDAEAAGLPPISRLQMPADWSEFLGPGFLGVVRYTRKFNKPTNLDEHERVWLVVEPPRSCGRVQLNGTELGSVRFGSPAGRFDITRLLEDYNSVIVDVEHPELDERSSIFVPGGLVGEIRLEIEGS